APAYQLPIANGPFQPTADSLKAYQAPAWFRDAKFGIWAHWGPQSVGRSGDWYARWIYVPGHPFYAHHLEHYGHPSEVGYKDLIPLWKAEKLDPDALMSLYVAAGACTMTTSTCGIRAIIAGMRSQWGPSAISWARGVTRRAGAACASVCPNT